MSCSQLRSGSFSLPALSVLLLLSLLLSVLLLPVDALQSVRRRRPSSIARFFHFWEFAPPSENKAASPKTTESESIPAAERSTTTTTTTTTTTRTTTTRTFTTTFTTPYLPKPQTIPVESSRFMSFSVNEEVSTVAWTPPTTIDLCDRTDDDGLLARLKDSGAYNEIYMAVDFEGAVEHFVDLKKFSGPRNLYSCDETWPPPVKLPRRTWWVPDEWDTLRGDREKRSTPKLAALFLENIQLRVQSVLEQLTLFVNNEDSIPKHDEKFEELVNIRKTRRKRNSPSMAEKNSGISRGVVGTTISVECEDSHSNAKRPPDEGYHFCPSCRAIRHLPKTYFPRILNEVVCAESSCFQDQGRCVQQFLPQKILHNSGTPACPRWKLVTIALRTCCDCQLSPYSPFVRYLL